MWAFFKRVSPMRGKIGVHGTGFYKQSVFPYWYLSFFTHHSLLISGYTNIQLFQFIPLVTDICICVKRSYFYKWATIHASNTVPIHHLQKWPHSPYLFVSMTR